MTITAVIVGINQWEEFTRPARDSFARPESAVRVVLVDNGSEPPYPEAGVRIGKRVSYAAAINAGALAAGDPDWLLVLNNDVIALGPFADQVEALDPRALYGAQIIRHAGLTWLGGWLYVVSRACRRAVGEWDEQFQVCGFEDCDYSLRAAAAGFPTKLVRLPVHHFWGKTRWGIPGYPKIRSENIARLEKKHGVSLDGDWMVEE